MWSLSARLHGMRCGFQNGKKKRSKFCLATVINSALMSSASQAGLSPTAVLLKLLDSHDLHGSPYNKVATLMWSTTTVGDQTMAKGLIKRSHLFISNKKRSIFFQIWAQLPSDLHSTLNPTGRVPVVGWITHITSPNLEMIIQSGCLFSVGFCQWDVSFTFFYFGIRAGCCVA